MAYITSKQLKSEKLKKVDVAKKEYLTEDAIRIVKAKKPVVVKPQVIPVSNIETKKEAILTTPIAPKKLAQKEAILTPIVPKKIQEFINEKPVAKRDPKISYEESKYQSMSKQETADIASPVLGALSSVGFTGGKEGAEIKKASPLAFNIGKGAGLLAGGVGTTAVAKKALSGVGLSTTGRILGEGALSGGLLAGGTTAIQDGIQGKKQYDIVKNAGVGAVAGAIGDLAISKGIGAIGKAISKNKLSTPIEIPTPSPRTGLAKPSGIDTDFLKPNLAPVKSVVPTGKTVSTTQLAEQKTFKDWSNKNFGNMLKSESDMKVAKELYLDETGKNMDDILSNTPKAVAKETPTLSIKPKYQQPLEKLLNIKSKNAPKAIGRGVEPLSAIKKSAVEEIEQQVVLKYNPVTDEMEEVLVPIASKKSVKPSTKVPSKGSLTEISKEVAPVTPNIPVKTAELGIEPAISAKQVVNIPSKNKLADSEIDSIFNEKFLPLAKLEGKVSLPATPEGLKSKGFVKNVISDYAMSNTTKEAVASLDKSDLFYKQLANTKTLEKAKLRFGQGFETAMQDLDNSIDTLDPSNVVLAKLLSEEATRRGYPEVGAKIIANITDRLTTAGQYTQSAVILRVADSPEALKSLMEVQLARINKQGLMRYGKKWNDISLSKDDLNIISKFKGLDNPNKMKILGDLHDSIQSKIPVTKLEKFNTWRHIAMLLNPKTQTRNYTGNWMMGNITKISDVVATGMEKLIPEAQRTKSLMVDKKLKSIAEKTWDENKSSILSETKFDDLSKFTFGLIEKNKRIFKSDALNELDKFTRFLMEKGDSGFLRKEFENSLGQFMTARKLTEPTKEAIEYARERALKQTFRNANGISQVITKFKSESDLKNVIGETFFPFSKTPTNIAYRAIDYSPLGVSKLLFSKGKYSPSQVVDILSQGLTGSGLMLLGYKLAGAGYARGAEESSYAKEQLQLEAGKLPRSVSFGGKSYSLDEIQPTAFPLIAGIMLHDVFNKKYANPEEAFMATIKSLYKSAGTLPMIGDIMDLASTDTKLMNELVDIPKDYLLQAVPTVFGQVARTADETKRKTPETGYVSQGINALKSKIPFATKTLPAKVGVFGNEEKRNVNVAQRAVDEFLMPITNKSAGQGKLVADEILRVYDSVQSEEYKADEKKAKQYKALKSSILPKTAQKSFSYNGKTIPLSPKLQSEYQKLVGTRTIQKLEALKFTSSYKVASDIKKAQMIKHIMDVVEEQTNKEFYKKVK